MHNKTKINEVLGLGNCLIITHTKGGGTEQYVQNYVKNHNHRVIILRNLWYWKDIAYVLENPSNNICCVISYKELQKVFDKQYEEIIVNSFISYTRINYIQEKIRENKKQYIKTRINYLVHDFHAVCPRCNLIYKNWFCNLECKNNKCTFNSFYEATKLAISEWRMMWDIFFESVDNIIVFSMASKEIFSKIYKAYDKKIIIIPHDMSWCNFKPIHNEPHDEINIAFVGRCTTIPKGKLIVRDLCKLINQDYNVYMIGSSKDRRIKRKRLYWYGEYNHDELPEILQTKKIDVVIFPSVCPETFSYLISELMQMEISVISFDFGTQGEKVSKYEKGRIINREGVGSINEVINSLI